jgi:hypothetical protein
MDKHLTVEQIMEILKVSREEAEILQKHWDKFQELSKGLTEDQIRDTFKTVLQRKRNAS